VTATDPLGRPIQAEWLALDGGATGFVEMAAASGLARLAHAERTPASARMATTRGTGGLVQAALDAGVRRIVVGLGGSATTDGGAGLLAEMGLRLLDARGDEVPDGGAALATLDHVDADGLDPRLAEVEIVIASDVTNPLTGPNGAAASYGPQKGADPDAVAELDAALVRWGAEILRATGRDVAEVRGAGAAGGTTAGLLGFTAAELRSGVEVVAARGRTWSSPARGEPTSRPWPARRRWESPITPATPRSSCCAAAWARAPRSSRSRGRLRWCSPSSIDHSAWKPRWPTPNACWPTQPLGWRAASASV
jgi:glycerate kinase